MRKLRPRERSLCPVTQLEIQEPPVVCVDTCEDKESRVDGNPPYHRLGSEVRRVREDFDFPNGFLHHLG